ncbi:MAG: hypothetical protein WD646_02445 [Actinomycetota bacterium]
MSKSIIRSAAVALTAGLLMTMAPGVLGQEEAPGERSIESVKQRCIRAIDARLHRIDRLQNAVSSSRHVTPRHEAILEGQLADAQAGLTRLKAQIRAEDDREEIRRLCRSIVTEYRIYVLVTPRTMLTLAADAAVAAANKLDDVADRIQYAIDEAAAEGKDVTEAQAQLDSMRSHIEAAKASAGSVPDAVLPLTPSDWPGAQEVLRQAKQDLDEAREDLRAAKQDGYDAVEALKEA